MRDSGNGSFTGRTFSVDALPTTWSINYVGLPEDFEEEVELSEDGFPADDHENGEIPADEDPGFGGGEVDSWAFL